MERPRGSFSNPEKVESKGLIYREVDPENDNRFHLFLTEKGKELNEAHRKYDEIGFGESMDIVTVKHNLPGSQKSADFPLETFSSFLKNYELS